MVLLRIFIDQQGQAKDMISIFDTIKWYYTFSFVSELQDAAAYNRLIHDKIVIWESANQRGMIHVYKVKNHQVLLIQVYNPSTPIKSLQLHCRIIFVGISYSKLHLLNKIIWFQTYSFDMNWTALTVTNTDELLKIYKEIRQTIEYCTKHLTFRLPAALKYD